MNLKNKKNNISGSTSREMLLKIFRDWSVIILASSTYT